jgi:hypothetical protein
MLCVRKQLLAQLLVRRRLHRQRSSVGDIGLKVH